MNNKLEIFNKILNKKTSETKFSKKIKDIEQKLNDYEKNMILNIINLKNISVKEVMVPRVDVIGIDKNSDINEIIKIVEEKGRSRLPVYDENMDNIVGILHSKDLLKYFTNNNESFHLSKIIRPAYFIPEYKMINDLLIEMREKKIHLAVVVDEYGGMSGIVCMEDIIEKIVGDIQDEFDNEIDDIIKIEDNKFLINPRITITDLNNQLGTDFDSEQIDTLSGLLYILFGKIPSKNEKIQYKNCIFTIESISARKIKKVKLEILNNDILNNKENEEINK